MAASASSPPCRIPARRRPSSPTGLARARPGPTRPRRDHPAPPLDAVPERRDAPQTPGAASPHHSLPATPRRNRMAQDQRVIAAAPFAS